MTTRKVTHRERLEACLAEAPLDRPPVALWRHFPGDDQTPSGLAAAQLAYQHLYDFDLVKVTPASSFCLKDWGVTDEWRGNPEGTREYTRLAIQHPEDWERLPRLDPTQGYLGDQLECLRLITRELGQDTPVLQTIFSPLSQAKNLVGKERLVVHLRRYPDALHAGLEIIAESTRRFIEAAAETGIAGIFYAVQHAQYSLLSVDEWEDFGRNYDLEVLDAARGLWANLLHLHGLDVMFSGVADYPVEMINWHDRETEPGLAEGKQRFGGAVCGGLRVETVTLGTPETVAAEARQAVSATGGSRFILGTGCVVPVIAPHSNIMAARRSVEIER